MTSFKRCVCTTADGAPKKPYEGRAFALQGAARLDLLGDVNPRAKISVYPCPTSDAWHVTTASPKVERRWDEVRSIEEFGERIDAYLGGTLPSTPWRSRAMHPAALKTAEAIIRLRKLGILVADFGIGYKNGTKQHVARSWVGGLADPDTARRAITAATKLGLYVAAYGPDFNLNESAAPEVEAQIHEGIPFGIVAPGTDWLAEADPALIGDRVRADLEDLTSLTFIDLNWGTTKVFGQLADAMTSGVDSWMPSLGILDQKKAGAA